MLGWLPPFLRVVWRRSLFCVPVCLGLLYAGDKLVEVNGVSVEGLDPEQVIHILVTVLLALPMTHCGVASSPWRVHRDWRGIRVPVGSLLSPGPRTCLFPCISSPLPASSPQLTWTLLEMSFPSCSFSLRKTAQVLITWAALLETEPGVGRVRLWRSLDLSKPPFAPLTFLCYFFEAALR